MSASSSTMPTPTSRRSGNGLKKVRREPPSGPMTATSVRGETYKQVVKLAFFRGASLEDPEKLFTQPGTLRRAIDIREGEVINEAAFKQLIRAAVDANSAARAQRSAKKR